MFAGGLRPHAYCLPVAKREEHRLAVRKAATSGSAKFFLGTDSAPHARDAKESGCGCAGIFNAPFALESYATVFDEEGALDRLEGFASEHGARFYGLPLNDGTVTLERGAGDGARGDWRDRPVPRRRDASAGDWLPNAGDRRIFGASDTEEAIMLVLALLAAAAAPEVGKTMAMDDWHSASIIAVGGDPATGAPVLHLRSAGDLDGDGVADEAYLKIACSGGTVQEALVSFGQEPARRGLRPGHRQTHAPSRHLRQGMGRGDAAVERDQAEL